MSCEARQYSDQMQCGRCGLAWDMNDPDPPQCKRATDRRAIPERRFTRFAVTSGDPNAMGKEPARRFTVVITAQIPEQLVDTALAGAMARAYEAHAGAGGSPVEAMQAAYRVFMGSLP